MESLSTALGCLTGPVIGIIIFVVIFLFANIKQINQYEAGVLFTLGKYTKMLNPGWTFVWPIFQRVMIVDLRTRAVEVEGQDTMTSDNVSVHVTAVIYYKVVDASKAIIKVQYADNAVEQFAQTSMRNIIGESTLNEVLTHRAKISKNIEDTVAQTSNNWGIEIENVELKDIKLPEDLKRTMAKVAEAQRERDANILKSTGEIEAAENLKKAADLMAQTPGALHLRTLNSINDISSDQSNTVVFAIPIEILRAIEGIGEKMRSGSK